MRKLFSRQLIEARHEMLSIFEAIDLTLHDAVNAFVVDDKELARRAQQATLAIDARSANLEAVCYNLIATQSPVASDFRLLQTIIYVNFNLQRMSDKVRRIARAAKRKVNNDIELPAELVDLIQRESECVYRVLGASASALVNNDLAAMADLAQRDDEGELESMRIPSGEGVTLDPVRDARAVASLAPDEVGGKLASLIREIESEDGGE